MKKRASQSSESLLTIQESADLLKVNAKTLRRWEEKGVLIPLRSEGGHRRYIKQHVLDFKKQLKKKLHLHLAETASAVQNSPVQLEKVQPPAIQIQQPNAVAEQLIPGLISVNHAVSDTVPIQRQLPEVKAYVSPTLPAFFTPTSKPETVAPAFPNATRGAIQPDAKIEIPQLYESLHKDQRQFLKRSGALFALVIAIFILLKLSPTAAQALASVAERVGVTLPFQKTAQTQALAEKTNLRSMVLGDLRVNDNLVFKISVPTHFLDKGTFDKDITVSGTIAANGGSVTTTASTFNLVNTTATTVNIAGQASSVVIGSTAGITEIKNALNVADITKIKGVPYSFPIAQGASATFLQNDGTGKLAWQTVTIPTQLSNLSDFSGTLDVGHGGTGTTSFGSGSVVFSDGSKLIGDSANFFFDAGNKRLGILTNSPQAALSVGSGSQFQVNSGGAITSVTGYTQSSGNFLVSGATSTITFSSLNTAGGVVYTDGTGKLGTVAGTSGDCLISGGAAAPIWGSCSGVPAAVQWEVANGSIYPVNNSLDLLVGGNSTASAKFAVLNINSGTPTVTVNGVGVSTFLTADGNLQTTNNQTLTLGGNTTGSIVLNPSNGTGTTTNNGNTILNGTLNASGTVTFPNYSIQSGIFYANASGLLVQVPQGASGTLLHGAGAGAPIWSAIDLTSDQVVNTLQIANGGTNSTATPTAGAVAYGTGTAYAFSGVGSAGQCLVSGGVGSPTWTTCATPTNQEQLFVSLNGAIVPINSTEDFFIGGQSTPSAKFAFLNVNSGTPTASISGSAAGNALSMNGDGTIATSNNRTLALNPNGGNVGVGTANPAALFSVGSSSEFQVSASGAVTAATSGNTINGLIINGGALTGITNYTQSIGNFNMSGAGNFTTGTGTVSLNGDTTIATGKVLTIASLNTPGGVVYTNGTGQLNTVAGTSGQCLLSGGASAPVWGSCDSLLAVDIFQNLNGAIVPYNSTEDFLIGGQSTASAKFAFVNVNSGTPAFQIGGVNVLTGTSLGSGVTTSSLTTVGALNSGSIASGFGTITTGNTITGSTVNGTTGVNTGAGAGTQRIDSSGNLVAIASITANGTITFSSLNTASGLLYADASGVIGQTAQGATGTVLHGNGAGVPTFSAIALSGDVSGILPIANGGTNGTATPTAGAVAYGTGTEYAFTAAGTNGDCLISGGASTPIWGSCAGASVSSPFVAINGAIVPLNNTQDFLVGGQSTAAAKIAFININSANPTIQINGADVLSETALGNGVVSSNLSSVGALNSGSIASGFGTITTANTITGSTINGTTGINTGAGAGTQRVDGSGNLLNIGTLNLSGAITGPTITNTINGLIINSGALSGVTGYTQTSGNFAISGAGTFGTGTGSISLNGDTTIATGKTLTIAALNTAGGVVYTDGAGTLGSIAGAAGECLISGGASAPTFGTCTGAFTSSPFTVANGSIIPLNSTLDLLVGGQSTASAKFAFLNVNSGTPTASISGSTAGNALSLNGDGSISTALNRSLALNANGGNVGVGTATPASLFAVGSTSQFQINSTGQITAATGITSSGAVTFSALNTQSGLVYADNLGQLIQTAQGAAGTVLHGNGAGAPTFSAIALSGDVSGVLPIANGGTNGTATPTAGAIAYGTGTAYDFSVVGSAGQCLVSGGAAAPTWGTCTGSFTSSPFQVTNGAINPLNSTNDFLVGGQSTASAKFAFFNVNSGTPTASISGSTGALSLTADGKITTTNAQTLTLGGATNGDISINPSNGAGTTTNNGSFVSTGSITGNSTITGTTINGTTGVNTGIGAGTQRIDALGNLIAINDISAGGSITFSALNTQSGVLFTNSSGLIAQTAQGAAGTVLHGNGASAPSFSALSLTTDVSGVLPIANGGTNGTAAPTAGALAYGTGTAYAFSVAGSAGQCLVSGGASAPTWGTCTGSFTSSPFTSLNGAIVPLNSTQDFLVGGQTTASAKFAFVNVNSGTPALQIGGVNVLTGTTLGTGVTTSSLTTVGALNSGSIASGFGTIATANTITGTTVNGTTGINTGAGAGTIRLDSSGNLSNIGTINASGAITGATSVNTINGLVINSGALSAVTGYAQSSGNFAISGGGTFGTGTGSISLNGDTTIATGKTLTIAALNTAGGVTYTNGAGTLGTSAAGSAGQCLVSGGAGAPTWGTCTGSFTSSPFTTANGAIIPLNSTQDFLVGGQATAAAKFAFINVNSGTPTASIAGSVAGNALSLNGDGSITTSLNRSLALNATGGRVGVGTATPVSALEVNGTITATGLTLNLGSDATGDVYYRNASGTIQRLGVGSAGQVLTVTAGIPSWTGGGGTGGSGYFNRTGTTLSPINAGDDITTSGNIYTTGTGTVTSAGLLTASNGLTISSGAVTITSLSNAGGVVYTSGSGVLGSVPGLAGQCLVSNGSSAPSWSSCSAAASNFWEIANGAIYPVNNSVDEFIGGNSTASAKFAFINVASGAPAFQISGTTVLTGSTLGAGVTTSSLTTVGALNSGSIASGFGTITTGNTITGTTVNGTTGINTGAGAGTVRIDNAGNLTNIGTLNLSGAITGATSTNTINGIVINAGAISAVTGYAQSSGNFAISGGGTFGTGTGSISLNGDTTIATGKTLTIAALNTAGGVTYTNGSGTLGTSAAGSAGQCLVSNGASAPSWTSCATGSVVQSPFKTSNGAIIPLNSTQDFLVGGQSTAAAKFAFLNVDSGTPTASIAGSVAGNALSLNGDGSITTAFNKSLALNPAGGNVGIGNAAPASLFAVGSSSQFQVNSSGAIGAATGITSSGTITFSGLNTVNGLLYANGSGVLAQTAQGAANTVLHGNGASAPTFGKVSLTADVSGVLPIANGGTNGSATPTNGGISYGTGTAYAFSVAGSAGQCLISGGAATPTWTSCATGSTVQSPFSIANGAIIPLNSTQDFLVGGQTTASAKFAFVNVNSGTPALQISGVNVLTGTTLGTGVTTSSLTTVGALNSGSIASGFGTIVTANTITGTTLNGTTGVNTGAGAGTIRLDSSGNLSNIGTINASGTVTFSSLANGLVRSTSGVLSGGNTVALSSEVTGLLPIANGGTNGSATPTNGGISYGTGTAYAFSVAGSAGQCLVSGAAAAPTWGTCTGSFTSSPFTSLNGAIIPLNSTQDFLVGGQSSAAAKFAFLNVAGGTPTASIAGSVAGNALSLNGDGTIQTSKNRTLALNPAGGNVGVGTATPAGLFAVGSGSPFTINSTGQITAATGITSSGSVTFSGLNTQSGLVYANNLGQLAQTAQGAINTVLHGNGAGAPTFSAIALASDVSGVLPIANGGTNGSATPTAGAIAYGTGTAYAFSTAGSAGQCLVSGGASTPTWGTCTGSFTSSPFTTANGAIIPLNSTQDFLVGGQSTAAAKFAFINVNSGTPAIQIGGTTVLNNTTLGSGVINSSLTAVGALNSGSIASGFGTIATTNTITGTTVNGTTGVNTGAGAGTVRLDSSGNLSNIGTINASGTVTFSSLANGLVRSTSGVLSGGSSVALSSEVSGVLPIANGGTNGSATPTAGAIAYGTGTAYAFSTAGSAGQCLVSGGASTPTWGTCTGSFTSSPFTTANGAIIPLNSTQDFLVGGQTTASAKFAFVNVNSGTPALQIGGVNVLTGTTLGTGVTTSSLTTVGALNSGSIASGFGTITTGNTITGTTVNGTTGINTGAGAGTIRLDSSGNLSNIGTINASGAITGATSTNTINGLVINSGALSAVTGYAQSSGNFAISGAGTFGTGTGSISLNGDTNIATGKTLTIAALNTAGGVTYTNGSGTLGTSAAGSAGQCLVSGGAGAPTWGTCTGSFTSSPFTTANGAIIPLNSTQDFLVGGQATAAAKFAFLNVAGGTPTASIAGSVAGNALSLNGDGSITTSLNRSLALNPNGGRVGVGTATPVSALEVNGTITATGLTLNLGSDATGDVYYRNASGTIQRLGVGSAGQVLTVTGGVPSWAGGSGSGGSGYFTRTGTTLSPINAGDNITATGNISTTGTGTVTSAGLLTGANGLTISSGAVTITSLNTAGGVVYTNGSGVLGSVAGAAGQCLVSNGSSAPSWSSCSAAASNYWEVANGAIYPINNSVDEFIGGNSTASAKFAFINVASGAPAFQISGTTVLTGSTLGAGVTTSSLTTVGALNSGSIASGFGTITTGNTITGTTVNGTTGINTGAGAGTIRLDSSGNLSNIGTINASGTVTFSSLANGLVRSTSGVLSGAGTVALSSEVTGLLPIANGGTNGSATPTAGALAYGTGTAYAFSTAGTVGQCLVSGGASTPTWGTCTGSFTSSPFQVTNGTINPLNSTTDFLVGGQSTASAKFAFLNVNSGTPTASIAGSVAGNALSLSGDGGISTTQNRSLILNQTGGNVGIGIANPLSRLDIQSIALNTDVERWMAFDGSRLGRFTETGSGAGWFEVDNASGGAVGLIRGDNGSSYVSNALGGNFGVGTSAPTALLHVSGGYGANDAFTVNQNSSGTNILTASASGVTKFTLGTNGNIGATGTITGLTGITSSGTITLSSLNTAGGIVYTDGAGILGTSAAGSAGQCLVSGGAAAPTWGTCTGSFISSPFQVTNGAINPLNSTNDFLVGGQSTASAKFAVLNVNNGTPTASVSGTTGATYLTADGKLATTARQSLTLGDATTTGNVLFNQGGNIGIGVATPQYPVSINKNVPAGNDATIVNITGTATDASSYQSGLYVNPIFNPTTTSTQENTAVKFIAQGSNGNSTNLIGLNGGVYFTGSALGNAFGEILINTNASSGTIGKAIGAYVKPTANTGGGSITNVAGIMIDAQSVGTNNTNLVIGSGNIPTGNFSIYNSSTNNNYFGGNLGIGDTTPAALLTVGAGDLFQVNSSGQIAAAAGITSSGTITFSGLNTAGGVTYTNGAGVLGTSAAGSAGQCLVSGGASAPTWGTCTGSFTSSPFTTANGAIIPLNSTQDFLVGGQSTASAKFAVLNVNNGTPTASIAGSVAGNALSLTGDGTITTSLNRSLALNPNGGRVGVGTATPSNLFSVGSSSQFQINAAGQIAAATGITSSGTINFSGLADGLVRSTSGVLSGAGSVNLSSEVTNVLPIANGGTNGTATPTAGALSYGTGTAYAFSTVGSAGQCLVSGGASAPTWGTCTGSFTSSPFQVTNGAINPLNSTNDFLVGGQSTASAKFAFLNVNSGTPVASIAGSAAGRAVSLDGDGTLQTTLNRSLALNPNGGNVSIGNSVPTSLFSVGSSSQFQVNSSGQIAAAAGITSSGTITFSGLNTVNGVLYANGSGVLAQTAQGAAGTVLHGNGASAPTFSAISLTADVSGILPIANGGTNSNASPTAGGLSYGTGTAYAFTGAGSAGQCIVSAGASAPSWGSCAGASGNVFQSLNGAIVPYNSTQDFLVGGQSTAAAKFAFLNVAGGTPTASIAGSVAGNALSLTGDGTITTSLNRSLALNPNGGFVGVGTSTPASLFAVGSGSPFTINSAGQITAAAGVTSSGSITFSGLNTVSGLVYANGSGVLAQTAQGATGTVLHGNGASAPTFSAISLTADVSGVLPIANGGTNSNASPTAGGISYGTGTAYAFSAAGSSGQCLISGGAGSPTWTSCAGSSGSVFQSLNGAIVPYNSTQDFLVGGQTTASAKFAILNVNSGTPTASLSGGTSGSLISTATGEIYTTQKQSLVIGNTASHSGTGNVLINPTGSLYSLVGIGTNRPSEALTVRALNSGTVINIRDSTDTSSVLNLGSSGTDGLVQASSGDLILSSLAGAGHVVFPSLNTAGGVTYTNSSGGLLTSAAGVSGQCLVSNGASAPSWTTCSTGSAVQSPFQVTAGAINPLNSTQDFLIGGQSSAAAKFAVLNVNSGTPTASLSAGAAGGSFFTASGSAQTTARQTLSLGGGTTGNVQINNTLNTPFAFFDTTNSRFGLGTTAPAAKLDVQDANITTGNGIAGTFNGLTSGKALALSSTSNALTTGGLASFDWSPTSSTTATGDLVSLNVGANGTIGNIFNVKNNGSSVFSISQTGITANLPTAFTAPGDVTFAYDQQFSNPTASFIKSAAPLTIASGEVFNSDDLTLRSYNSGRVILDSPGGTVITNLTNQGAIPYITDTIGTIGQSSVGTAGQCLVSGGTAVPTWGTCGGGSASPFQVTAGAINPLNSTQDFLVGGQSTAAAKFAFLNVAGGTPTASIAGSVAGNALSLTGDGTISTSKNRSLALNPTGGFVGVGVAAPNSLFSVGASSAFQINSTGDITQLSGVAGSGLTGTQLSLISNGGITQVVNTSAVAGSGINLGGQDLVTFTTSGLERLRVDAAGRLGLGTTVPLATLDIRSKSASNPVASISGLTTNASLILDQSGSGDIFTASVSGLTKFNINNAGNVSISNLSLGGGVVYTNGSGTLGSVAGTSGQCLVSNGASAPSWTSCSTGSAVQSPFQVTNGAINALNSTQDFLVGGQTTASAKFAVLNVNSGTPTASLSASGASGLYFTASGSAQTTGRQTLSFGGGTTGNIQFNNTLNTPFAQFDTTNSRFGLGTTAPAAKLDVQDVAITSGNGIAGAFNGLTSGIGLAMSSTSNALTTGGLASFDWSPTSSTTATGDLVSLNVGANGTIGNIFNVKNNGSSVFSVSQNQITLALPTQFTAPGDIGAAYDLQFTNPTASFIKSVAPLYLQSGETFNSSDLTLKTFNSGQVVFDSPGGISQVQAQNWTLPTSTSALTFNTNLLQLDSTNGRVGIGTASAAYKLDVSDSQSSTYTAQISNLSTNTSQRVLAIRIGIKSATSTVRYIDFLNNDGRVQGKIAGATTGNNGVTYTTTTGDFGEYFQKDDSAANLPVGTLVCQGDKGVRACQTGDTSRIVGIVSGTAGFLGGEEGSDKVIVGLTGQLPLRVNSAHGIIKSGDAISFSNKSGIGAKISRSGGTVGIALEDYTDTDPNHEGSIQVYVHPVYANPDDSLVQGDVNNYSFSELVNGSFIVNTPAGQLTDKVIAASDAVVGNLTAGNIKAKSIQTDSLSIGSLTLGQYIAQVVQGMNIGQNFSATGSGTTAQDNGTTASGSGSLADQGLQLASSSAQVASGAAQIRLSHDQLNSTANDVVIDAQATFLSSYLETAGNAFVGNNLGVNSNIVLGKGLAINDNGIDYLDTIAVADRQLNILGSGKGSLNILAGKLKIDDTGLVTIGGDVEVHGRITTSDPDVAGHAEIKTGDTQVSVYFSRPYQNVPVITATPDDSDAHFTISNKTVNGFTITLKAPPFSDTTFDWTAVSVIGAKTFESPSATLSGGLATGSGQVAGWTTP